MHVTVGSVAHVKCSTCESSLKVESAREVVVAQLVERWLPIPEVRGSNSVIGKNLLISNICILSTVYWKDENKEKEAGNGPFFLKKVESAMLFWMLLDMRFLIQMLCIPRFPPSVFFEKIDLFLLKKEFWKIVEIPMSQTIGSHFSKTGKTKFFPAF